MAWQVSCKSTRWAEIPPAQLTTILCHIQESRAMWFGYNSILGTVIVSSKCPRSFLKVVYVLNCYTKNTLLIWQGDSRFNEIVYLELSQPRWKVRIRSEFSYSSEPGHSLLVSISICREETNKLLWRSEKGGGVSTQSAARPKDYQKHRVATTMQSSIDVKWSNLTLMWAHLPTPYTLCNW